MFYDISCSKIIVKKGLKVKATFSSIAMHKARKKDPNWKLTAINQNIKQKKLGTKNIQGLSDKGKKRREKSLRNKTITYHYDFIWKNKE